MQIGRFFSNIVKGEPKTPKPTKQELHPALQLVNAAIANELIKNALNINAYHAVTADFNQDENRIEIQIRF